MQENTHQPIQEPNLSLADIVRGIRGGFKKIILITGIFVAIGIAIALLSPVEYRSEVQLMPELQSKSGGILGRLGSLAGLAGLSLDNMNSTEAVRPDLYPNVFQSPIFVLHILGQKVYSKEFNKEMTLEQYFEAHDKATFNLFGTGKEPKPEDLVLPDPKNYSKTFQVSKRRDALIKDINKRIVAGIDKKNGIISISVKMPDPIVAATVARISMDYLTEYVTNYRTEKARADLEYYQKLTGNARGRYLNSQASVSAKKDRMLNFILQSSQDEVKKLEYDANLSYNTYSGLSQKLEEARIKIQEETPVFKILVPPQVPLKRSEPQRTLIVLAFGLVGGIISVIYVLAKRFGMSGLLG